MMWLTSRPALSMAPVAVSLQKPLFMTPALLSVPMGWVEEKDTEGRVQNSKTDDNHDT